MTGESPDTGGRLPIVAGVEGSEAGLAAARWAAREAALSGRSLQLVHSHQPGEPDQPLAAEAVLAVALDAARVQAPQVAVSAHAYAAPTTQTLVDLSAVAALVVVGHRGHGLGSALRELRSPVASGVTAYARGPVVIVRAGAAEGPAADGPVVVGVDGSTASGLALEFALREAVLHRVALHVVRVAGEPPASGTDTVDLDAVERGLYAWVGPWRERYPQLPVSVTVAAGHPMCALADASREAGLLVIGARGDGGRRRPLGSVSQQLVHLAAGPVAVIRPGPLAAPSRRLPAVRPAAA